MGIGIAVFATGMYTVSLNVAFIYMFLTGALALSKDKVFIESNAPRIISAALGFREKENKRRKKVISEKV